MLIQETGNWIKLNKTSILNPVYEPNIAGKKYDLC